MSALADDLRRRVPGGRVDGSVQQVGEEEPRGLPVGIVVDGQGEDVPDVLVHPRFACPDFADTGKQFLEMVGQAVAAL